MNGLLVIALFAIASTATAYDVYGTTGSETTSLIGTGFHVYGELTFTYDISFPKSSKSVSLLKMGRYEDVQPCSNHQHNAWSLTLSDTDSMCFWERSDPTYGDMIRCTGKFTIYEWSEKEQMFMLYKCDMNGLWGVEYKIYTYDQPMVSGSARSTTPTLLGLCLATLLTALWSL